MNVWLCLVLGGMVSMGAIEQADNTWVLRRSSPPLVDDGVAPRISYESSLAYDARRRVFVMWGGHGMRTDSPQLDETWLYDLHANRWRKVATDRAPVGSCCVRDSAYDEANGVVVQFEGHHGNHGWQLRRGMASRRSAPWVFDTGTEQWTPMRPIRAPRVRPYKGFTYDSTHQVVLLFAGEGRPNDTWVYDAWTNTWTEMRPKPVPARRLAHGFAFHRAAGRAVLFGSSGYQDYNDTWTYDLAANRWMRMHPKTPPPKGGGPVMAYDSLNGRMVAFYGEAGSRGVRVFEYDLESNTWTELRQRGPRPRYRDFAVAYSPDHNLFVMGPGHASWNTGAPTTRQTWTYRLRTPTTRPSGPEAPAGVRLDVKPGAITVRWNRSPGAATYVVLRGEGAAPWRVNLARYANARMNEGGMTDHFVKPGRIYYYAVIAFDEEGRVSPRSRFVRSQPRVPTGVVASVVSEDEVRLTWPKHPSPSVVGYAVHRALCESRRKVGTFVRLNADVVNGTSFVDRVSLKTGAEGKRPLYAYVVRAVDCRGIESGPSPMVFTMPSDPARPRVTEHDDGRVTLAWKSNPEQGLKGYLIWRLDSARDRGTIITPEPIPGTTYTDAAVKGNKMRRHYLVAVDALGQRGIPSSPAWAFRESTAMPLD